MLYGVLSCWKLKLYKHNCYIDIKYYKVIKYQLDHVTDIKIVGNQCCNQNRKKKYLGFQN